ncbi:D-Ala-D-Ala carboxypeptidase family metallohydrolase [Mesorhizobium sp. KR2-14]|uniref:YcbK family protein n=1 Tax=Mesorhizobium sp. KR2-14 TaxID=3156610 RepID=UPI0032B56A86
MTAVGTRVAKRESRAVLAALCCALLASCTSTNDPNLDFNAPGFNVGVTPAEAVEVAVDGNEAAPAEGAQLAEATPAAADANTAPAMTTVMDANDKELPLAVAYLPTAKPANGATISLQEAVAAEAQAERLAIAAAQAAEPAKPAAAAETQADATPTGSLPEAAPSQVVAAAEATIAPSPDTGVAVQAESSAASTPKAAQPEAPKKKGFFTSLFGSPSSASPVTPTASGRGAPGVSAKPLIATAAPASKPLIETAEQPQAKPIIQIAAADPSAKPAALASITGESALPGVRQSGLFEITRKSGIDDDSDVDLHEDEAGTYQLASAAGLARLAPNGLLRQTENVDIACLKPSLVRMLKAIEQRYGGKIIVTSGYRSPSHNRRARGAKNSLHMYCAAADIQIEGVSKWELANYVRSMPGRGGVGTYCHTDSVHVDVGPERDWNWRCRRRQ